MPRQLSQSILDQLASDEVHPFFMFTFEYSSETSRFWTGNTSLTYNGNVYNGTGDAITVSSISETEEIRAENIEFTLSGVPTDLVSTALQEPYQGRPCDVKLGFMNEDAGIVDVFTAWEGRMDVKKIDENTENLSIVLNAENRLVDLKRTRERRYTDEDQKAEYPNDDFFEYVPSIQEREIEWGR